VFTVKPLVLSLAKLYLLYRFILNRSKLSHTDKALSPIFITYTVAIWNCLVGLHQMPIWQPTYLGGNTLIYKRCKMSELGQLSIFLLLLACTMFLSFLNLGYMWITLDYIEK
jgi:hypothetical protein